MLLKIKKTNKQNGGHLEFTTPWDCGSASYPEDNCIVDHVTSVPLCKDSVEHQCPPGN
jgi:hypothetical protein